MNLLKQCDIFLRYDENKALYRVFGDGDMKTMPAYQVARFYGAMIAVNGKFYRLFSYTDKFLYYKECR